MTKVSVIIPVYNAENYIKECMDSLLGQSCGDFEAICVDDGSKDRSLEILRAYEKQDSRITVLTQKNQYAGAARNAGMERARGKYLLFLDADDFFSKDLLGEAVLEAEKKDTQILVFDACRYDDRQKEALKEPWRVLDKERFGSGVKSAAQLSEVLYSFGMPTPWNKLFLREYIEKNGLRFQGIKRANDVFFVYAALSCADRIGILDRKLLYYRINNTGSLQGSVDNTPDDFAKALYAVRDFLMDRGLWERYQKSFCDAARAHCVNNLGNLRTRGAFEFLYEKLRDEIMPALGIRGDQAEGQLLSAVRGKERLAIYGAGTLASVLIRILLFRYGYEPEELEAVVTKKGNNGPELWGVKIRELEAAAEQAGEKLTVIAVADKAVQEGIEKSLRERHFERIIRAGFQELLGLVR